MLRQVADKYSYIYYSDMEIVRGGVTHTIDTIEEFKKVNPDRKIYCLLERKISEIEIYGFNAIK